MPSWPVTRFTSWSYDEDNRLILLKVPEQIRLCPSNEKSLPPSLSTLDKLDQPPRIAPTLPLLPPEVLYTILNQLCPVDRVCLALTCHRLCANVLASPRLTAENWLRFTTITDSTTRYWNPTATYLSLAPEHYQLCQRLAHGWVDKSRWRYCWQCHKILPRDQEWWWNTRNSLGEKRIKGKKNIRWSLKTGVEKNEWAGWSKQRKLRWIIDVWCKAQWEDSSFIGCDWCRDKLYDDDLHRLHIELAETKSAVVSRSREMNVTEFVGTRHPVQCPSCLERELTYSWRPPKRVLIRKAFGSFVGCFRDWTIGLVWCIGSVLVALIMAIWECSRWAGETIYHRLIAPLIPRRSNCMAFH